MMASRRLAGRIMAGYRQALERFLPPAIAADREARNRALMFLISHAVGPVLGNTVPFALYAFDPTPGFQIAILAVSISLFWLFPFLLRGGVPYGMLVMLSVVNLNFCILWSCYHYGGVASPTLPWVLVIPILSLFYIGGDRRLQPHLLAITAVSFVIFMLAYTLHPPAPTDMPEAARQGLGAISTVATLAYVATMAIYYARIFDAGVDLEVEIKRRQLIADELRRAVIAADRSGAAKSEFLARMSHEIRAPLNAIIGYGELLQEEADETGDGLLGADVGRILDAGHYLLRLVDMILDLSKLEAGRMKFDVQPNSLRSLLETAVTKCRSAAEANAVQVGFEVSAASDAVEVDGKRVVQVIAGMIENAVRHSAGGLVTLTVSEGIARGIRVFSVVVRDTGTGIAPSLLPSLFKTFSASCEASAGRYGGTGLSLTVFSRLCQEMGGSLTAESLPGEGATFTMTLPRFGLQDASPLRGKSSLGPHASLLTTAA
jgi:signal transduction histidine kinase